MREAIAKADTLIEALAWIRRFRDRVTVIKLGGRVLEDDHALGHVLVDIVFMATVGMRPVVVHGGGDAISRAMQDTGVEPRFVRGRRYTDDATLEIVERILATELNENLARRLEQFGARAANLNFRTTCVLSGERIALTDEDGAAIDLGHVGQVTRVDTRTIENLLYAGLIPVIPSMAISDVTDEKLNVNADTAATAVAQSLSAEKLVFLSDTPGVMLDKNDPATLVHSLSAGPAHEMIARGQIDAGMIPKVEACLETLQRGVHKVHIIDSRLRHGLLLEIYTNQGVGTEFFREEDGAGSV